MPQRTLPRFGLPIALALSVSLAGAPNAAAAGADIYGVGGGSISVGGELKFIKFAFSAHTGPQGDFGSYRLTVENFFDVLVDVDCVNVFPNPPGAGAWIGGTVKKVTPTQNPYGIQPGDQALFGINDFGNPSDVLPDEHSAHFRQFFDQAYKLLQPGRQGPITQGNITIKLAP